MKKPNIQTKIEKLWSTYIIQPEKVRKELSFAEWVCVDRDWLVAERERQASAKANKKGGRQNEILV